MARDLRLRGATPLTNAVVPAGLDPLARFGIYRNNVTAVLTGALGINFPATLGLVGEQFFAAAASRFIAAAPPREACLAFYGVGFPDFLAAMPEARSVPYLADTARFEWALRVAAHAPDVAPLTPQDLAAIPAARHESLRFAAHPATSVLTLEYPADSIADAVLRDDDAAMAAVDLACGPVYLLISRNTEGVRAGRIAASARDTLSKLFAGTKFGALLAEGDPELIPLFAGQLAAGRLLLAPDNGA
jgi:hypothetical protein